MAVEPRHVTLRGRSHVHLSGVIALDGPSGTGKSSVAQLLAESLGARYLDTGAMYRAATWAVLHSGVHPGEPDRVVEVLAATQLSVTTDPADQQVLVNGVHVEREIRGTEVTAAVSEVSAVPEVRGRLVAAQRGLIGAGGIVVEGRDIGTVVWPAAELKVFLTAHPEQRALRRARQSGSHTAEDLAVTAEAIRRRDALDSGRAVGPLRPAEDAVILDSTEMTRLDVVRHLLVLADERGLVVHSGAERHAVLGAHSGMDRDAERSGTLPRPVPPERRAPVPARAGGSGRPASAGPPIQRGERGTAAVGAPAPARSDSERGAPR
jgi:cytidylate kinase